MISVYPISGLRNISTISISGIPSSVNPIIDWGDGTIDSFDNHIYSSVGSFNIFYNECSSVSSFSVDIYSGEYFTDYIQLQTSEVSSYVECPYPVTVSLSSSREINTVVLYSSGSNSYSYNNDRNFWSHLNPEWTFLKDDSPITEITLTGEKVYSSGVFIGYSASDVVYYKDSMPGNVKLVGTVQYKNDETLVNSNAFDTVNFSVSSLVPDILYITSDGINPMDKVQWADYPIPYVISVGSSTVSCSNILHYVSGYITDIKFVANCYGLDSSSFQTPLCSMELSDGCFKTGGYVMNTFVLPSSSLPDKQISNNLNPCEVNYDTLEYYTTQKLPKNVSISASGIFLVNGEEITLTGISEPFDVYPVENPHEFFRKGEDTNLYNFLSDALPFDVKQYSNFNTYLSSILGEGDSLGKIYDKIYNFTNDNSDLESCTLETLYDMSYQMDEPINDFELSMPEELKRLFHFSTIPLNKLIGSRCHCNNNFINCSNCANSNVCKICKFDKRSNLGEQITNSDFISAGDTILYKQNGSTVFNFFVVPEQSSTVYKLQSLSAEPFYSNGLDNYCFYNWDKTSQNNPVNSVVNYKDPRNKLLPSLSSNEDWYGKGGIVEKMFSFTLFNNLINK